MPRERFRQEERDMERSHSRHSGLRADSAHFADLSSPPMNRRRSTGHSAAAGGARPRFDNQASFMSSDTMISDESWPEEDAPEHRSRRDEQPMSPFVVILYVVFVYLVWQILTRSDDDEIFSHLPSTSPLRGQQQQPHAIAGHTSQQQPYQFPYPLPQFHSPVRDVEKVASSTWRTVVQSVLYPFYVLLTLAVIPLPFLNQALTLIMSIVGTILYPITSTTRLLSRTFIVGPLQIVNSLFQALYPAYVFVGGVLGLGCFLGVSAGYIGQYSLDFLLSRKSAKDRKSARRKTKKRRSHSARDPSSAEFATAGSSSRNARTELERSAGRHRQPLSTDVDFHGRYVPIVDIWDDLEPTAAQSSTSTSARQPVVIGLRRRGMRSTS